MNIETLRYYVELARTGSFYGAAKHLFISQQGLNKAMKALEAELGVKLMERGRRGIRLTGSGEVLLEHAETLLSQYSSMLDDLYAEYRYAEPSESHIVFHVTYYPAQISRPFIDGMNAIDQVSIVEEPFKRIVEGARNSDGSELYLLDVYEGTRQKIATFDDLIFEPILVSQFGVVWKDGSPLAGHRAIHREQLADFPLAVDSHREMLKLVESVMESYPLNNIRLGVAEPRTTLEFATKSNQVASTFDSFGFMLSQASAAIPTDGLNFTPFSTPRSLCQVGFLYSKNAKPNVRGRHAIERIKRYIQETYPNYLKRYPIE